MRRSLLTAFAVTALLALTSSSGVAQNRDPECTLGQQGGFSLGWTEKTAEATYRCVATFNAALKPSGAAWIKVNPDGTLGARLP